MSAYDNDPRVRWVNPHFATVHGNDRFHVFAEPATTWWTEPLHGTEAFHRDAAPQGPFPTSDAAIASLIGDPQ